MSFPAALSANAAPAMTGAMMCAISLAASREATAPVTPPQVMQINLPKLPNIQVPKLPVPNLPGIKLPELNLDLPNFGKKKEKKEKTETKSKLEEPRELLEGPAGLEPKSDKKLVVRGSRPTSGGKVKIRVSSRVQPSNPNAPSARQVTGYKVPDPITSNDGWKRYPSRRMPGANMDGFKEMAKKVGPGRK